MVFPMLDRRHELQRQVDELLSTARDGRIPEPDEHAGLDFKEEAGRRVKGGGILAGMPTNPVAAVKLADEVACMANSPGGGVLVVGVADDGELIGTELDVEWLRQRIDSGVGIAPDIAPRTVGGQRLLIVFVAEAREPVEDTHGRLRWRVGDECRPVDRTEWWVQRERRGAHDAFAAPSGIGTDGVTAGSVKVIRASMRRMVDGLDLTDGEILDRIGAVSADGSLTRAAALACTPVGRRVFDVAVFDVPGGSVLNTLLTDPGDSLLEQFDAVEKFIDALNTRITDASRFAHQYFPRVPTTAIREALLNAIIHRGWNLGEDIGVQWFDLDSTFVVRSPGGFPEQVTADTVLTRRHARYPALADFFRAIGLVEKQGVGVDRMYWAMISDGHHPPIYSDQDGYYVECTLTGGTPVWPIVDLIGALRPTARANDHRLSILIWTLLHEPFVTEETLAGHLQSEVAVAERALEVARQTMVRDEPLVEVFQGAHIFGAGAAELAKKVQGESASFLPFLGNSPEALGAATMSWLGSFGSITTTTLARLSEVSTPTARSFLNEQVESGVLRHVGAGRSSRYERA